MLLVVESLVKSVKLIKLAKFKVDTFANDPSPKVREDRESRSNDKEYRETMTRQRQTCYRIKWITDNSQWC